MEMLYWISNKLINDEHVGDRTMSNQKNSCNTGKVIINSSCNAKKPISVKMVIVPVIHIISLQKIGAIFAM